MVSHEFAIKSLKRHLVYLEGSDEGSYGPLDEVRDLEKRLKEAKERLREHENKTRFERESLQGAIDVLEGDKKG